MPKGLLFRYSDYLEFGEWSGRILREDKKGCIPEHLPDKLTRLNIDPRHWVYLTKDFGLRYVLTDACTGLRVLKNIYLS
jgi:hypothetical protein